MPGFRRKNKKKFTNKKSRKARRKATSRKKPLNKNEHKAVKKMIDIALDRRIEDKYKLDSEFSMNQAPSTWDSSTESCLINITPTIIEGADVNQRIGKKVTLKNFRCQIRYRPYSSMHVNPTDDVTTNDFTFSQNPYPQLPSGTAFFVSLPRETWNSTSSTDLRKAMAIKFKEPGVYTQDLLDSDGQKIVKAVKFHSKVSLRRRYRTDITFRQPYTDSVGSTIPQAAVIISSAQNTDAVIKSKLMKKELFETNEPARKVYLIYFQFGSKWYDQDYQVSLSRPQMLQTRVLWTYEDA